jgi:hypothetical protein
MKLRIKCMPEELDIAKIAQYEKHQIPIAPYYSLRFFCEIFSL